MQTHSATWVKGAFVLSRNRPQNFPHMSARRASLDIRGILLRCTTDHQRRCLLSFLLIVCWVFSSPYAGMATANPPANEAQEHADKGMNYLRLNDLTNSEVELRRAVELSPDSSEYLADLGVILGMEQKLKESTIYLERALKLDPENIMLKRNLASNLWQTGHTEQAKQTLEGILQANPRDARTILLLGMVEDTLGDYANAAKTLESAWELVQQQPDSIAALARSFYNTVCFRKVTIYCRKDSKRNWC